MNLENHSLAITQYQFEGSLCEQISRAATGQTNYITPATQRRLLAAELSFLYSTQYFAEANGEASLEGMRSMTYQPTKQDRILDCQIRDELEHTRLLKSIVETLGLDQQSDHFASGYVRILNSVETLAEKIFVFQIITEAVSAAYLQWRIQKINIAEFNSIDRQIYSDELRHLKMGNSLLGMCDPQEVGEHLDDDNRRRLVREMSRMCSHHFNSGIRRILAKEDIIIDLKSSPTDLDKLVAKTLLREVSRAAADPRAS